MGMVSVNAFSVHLESIPNFHDENLATFCLVFMVEIQQSFASGASYHTKCYYYQAFTVRIQQHGAPFSQRKSGRVSHLVRYGALTGFRVCVYGAYRHAHTETSPSPSKYQAC